MALVDDKKKVYYHYGYLIFDERLYLNNFESKTIEYWLWVLDINGDLPEDPQDTLAKLIETLNSDSGEVINRCNNYAPDTEKDAKFIKAIMSYLFNAPSTFKDQYSLLKAKIMGYALPENITLTSSSNNDEEESVKHKQTMINTKNGVSPISKEEPHQQGGYTDI